MSLVIGLNIAKSIFQVHGVHEGGDVVICKRLHRSQVLMLFARPEPALVGIEACHTAHRWGRETEKLGHKVRLMPPQFVKPYVTSQKNDTADAEAIAEAVTRPTMRFVPIKSADHQVASAIVATIGDGRHFQSGRQFAAGLGLMPQQNSSGGKARLGRITKRGDGYIRRLMIHGARSVVGWRKRRPVATDGWLNDLFGKAPRQHCDGGHGEQEHPDRLGAAAGWNDL